MSKGEVSELLKPRYKVIADYPAQHYSIGDVIDTDNPKLCSVCEDEFWLFNLDKYPAIFKKLQWWEEREASEMPRHIRIKETGDILEVYQWFKNSVGVWIADAKNAHYPIGFLEPATETE